MESMMASMDGMRGWHPWMAAMDKFLVGGKASKSIVGIASKAADAYDWGQCLPSFVPSLAAPMLEENEVMPRKSPLKSGPLSAGSASSRQRMNSQGPDLS